MKKLNIQLIALLFGTALTSVSCKKEGCTDMLAANYMEEADEDDGSCTYPNILINAGGDDGDVVGSGGSKTESHTWTNNQNRAALNMDMTEKTSGVFQIIVTDAAGTEVMNQTLDSSSEDDSLEKCSSAGQPGEWTVTVILKDFTGDGSFTLDQGC